MRKYLLIIVTFLGGLYYFLEFVLPEKIPTPPDRNCHGVFTHTGGVQEKDGWFTFKDMDAAANAAKWFGVKLDIPESLAARPVKLHYANLSITVAVKRNPSDNLPALTGAGWSLKNNEWRTMYDAQPVSFERLAYAMGGKYDDDDGSFGFDTADLAAAAAREMGAKVEIPKPLADKPATLRKFKEGKELVKTGVTIEIAAKDADSSKEIVDWKLKKSQWVQKFNAPRSFDEIVPIAKDFEVVADENEKFNFKEAGSVTEMVGNFGLVIKLPDSLLRQPAWLQRQSDKLVIAVKQDESGQAQEMTGWVQAGGWWMRGFFEPPHIMNLKFRARDSGAEVDPDGNCIFKKAGTLAKVASEFGVTVDVPESLADRMAKWTRKAGDITVEIEGRAADNPDRIGTGWKFVTGKWVKSCETYNYFVFGGYNQEILGEFMALWALTFLIGFISIFSNHGVNVIMRKKGWINSTALIVAMFISMALGFWEWSNSANQSAGFNISQFSKQIGLIQNQFVMGTGGLLTGLSSAIFSLLGVYMASAAYRTFRLKSGEAFVMMMAALLIMTGQISIGAVFLDSVFNWFGVTGGVVIARQWVMTTISTPAFRAIGFGFAVAGLVQAMRLWFSMESSMKEK